MMTCEDFDILMADALGDELSDADRPAFEAHLAECEKCRREYETASRAVVTMRELPGPERITVRREGNRLVIEDKRAAARAAGFSLRGREPGAPLSRWFGYPRGLKPAARRFGGVFRYAASILIAFTAGYALHAGLMLTDVGRPVVHVAQPDDVSTEAASVGNLQQALVNAHVRKPARSDLAKCLIAMAHPKD